MKEKGRYRRAPRYNIGYAADSQMRGDNLTEEVLFYIEAKPPLIKGLHPQGFVI